MRLYLPEQYRWFDFGGTMRLVGEEADLQAGYVKFQTKQTEQTPGRRSSTATSLPRSGRRTT